MSATATLMRWPDAAPLLGIETREVLDLIGAGELNLSTNMRSLRDT